MLTNMDPPLEEGNFCDDSKQAVKPQIVAQYNWHMGYVDISDRTANSHSMCQRTFKWTTKLFFHLLDQTVINSCILLSSCGAKYTHQYFRLFLVRNLKRAYITPPPDWLKDQMQAQKVFCDSRVAITNSGQRNQPPNCTAVCVLLTAKERAQCINVQDVMWVCARCHVSPKKKQKQISKAVLLQQACVCVCALCGD
jgi:hypothetical protein